MKNIKVSIKLGISIGAILLLIVILAANSLYNINQVLMRGNNTLHLTEIDSDSKSLLIASAQYKQTNKEQYIEETQALIRDIQRVISDVSPNLTEERGRASIARITENVDSYSKAFAANSAAQQNKVTNLQIAVSSGVQTNTLLNELRILINGTADNPIVHEDFYDTVTGRLAAGMVEARYKLAYTARIFLMEGTEQSLQNLEDAFTDLRDISEKIRPRLAPQETSILTEAMTSLDSYMDVLRQSYVLNQAQLETEQAMHAVYADLRTNINEILDIQTFFRAKVASNAKTTAIALTLIAIVLGSLIGLAIVRQITRPLNQAVQIPRRLATVT